MLTVRVQGACGAQQHIICQNRSFWAALIVAGAVVTELPAAIFFSVDA